MLLLLGNTEPVPPCMRVPPAPVTVAPRLEYQVPPSSNPSPPAEYKALFRAQWPPGLRHRSPHPTSTKVGGNGVQETGFSPHLPDSLQCPPNRGLPKSGPLQPSSPLSSAPLGFPYTPQGSTPGRALLLESGPGSDPGAILHSKTISDVTIPPRVISPR